ncbi:MAG: hypothetical protein M1541_04300 [Acidobacteria bacterium]|nr:hypothetical protein [Acidobacteriota bacterium]
MAVEVLAIERIPIFADVAVAARKPNVIIAAQARAQVMYLWPKARRFVAVA